MPSQACRNKDFYVEKTAQQAIRIREEKSVATKEFAVTTEISKDSKKSFRDKEKLCRDRVDRLKRTMFVATDSRSRRT